MPTVPTPQATTAMTPSLNAATRRTKRDQLISHLADVAILAVDLKLGQPFVSMCEVLADASMRQIPDPPTYAIGDRVQLAAEFCCTEVGEVRRLQTWEHPSGIVVDGAWVFWPIGHHEMTASVNATNERFVPLHHLVAA